MIRLMFGAVIVAALAVSLPARTQPKSNDAWAVSPPPSLQSAGVHTLVGTSFHAIHASF